MVGTIGDVTCFSFYANKTIIAAEGGMLATDDDKIAKRYVEEMSFRTDLSVIRETLKSIVNRR